MPVNKLTIEQFAAKIKAKHPEYNGIDDSLLTQKIINKYPEYKDMVNIPVPSQKQDFNPIVHQQTQQQPVTIQPFDYKATQLPKEAIESTGTPNTEIQDPSKFVSHEQNVQDARNRLVDVFNKHKDQAVKKISGEDFGNKLGDIQAKLQSGSITPEQFSSQRQQLIMDAMNHKQADEDIANNPDNTRKIYSHIAYTNPDLSKQIQHDYYLVDADKRQGDLGKVVPNADKIRNGELEYNIRNGVLIKPQNIFESIGTGLKNRSQTMDDYDFISSHHDADNIQKLENESKNVSPDEPVETPKGLGTLTYQVGQMGPTMLKQAAIGATAAIPVVGETLTPALMAYAGGSDFYKMGYVSSLKNNYYQLRNAGKSPEEAYSLAKNRAQFDATTDAVQGMASGVIGEHIASTPFKTVDFSKNFGNVMTDIVKNTGHFAADTGVEGGVNAFISGGLQQLKNMHSEKPDNEGVFEAGSGQLLFSYALGALTKGARGLLSPQSYKTVLSNISQLPEESINAETKKMVKDGSISPQDANDIKEAIAKQKEIDEKIPSTVTDSDTKVKIQDRIAQRDQLEKELETKDKAYHPDIKEKIKSINEDIVNLSNNISSPKIENNEKASEGDKTQEISNTEGAVKQNITGEEAVPSLLESRHADTIHDEKGIVSGPNDKELSKDGRKDAYSLAEEVKGKDITKIISSDLERAKETSNIVSDKIGVPTEIRPELRTWDIKDFDGLKDDQFKEVQKWFVNHPDETKYEGQNEEFKGKKIGETFNEYKDRVIKARQDIEKSDPKALLINHSNNMMVWDAFVKNGREWSDKAAQDYLKAEKPDPATLINKSEKTHHTISTPIITNVKLKENALPEKNALNLYQKDNGKLQGDKNIISGRVQKKLGSNPQVEGDYTPEEINKRIQTSSNWLEAISKNDSEASANAEKEFIRQSNEKNKQARNLLVNNDRGWSEIRTQGDNGEKNRSEAIEERADSSYRPKQSEQRSEQPPIGDSDRASEDSSSGIKARSLVKEILRMRDLQKNEISARRARELQKMLSKNKETKEEITKIINQEINIYHAIQKSSTRTLGAHGSGDESIRGADQSSGMGSGQQGERPTGEGVPPEKGKIQGEKTKDPNDITSLKNAITDQKRKEFGLSPAMSAAKKEFGTSWDEAMQKINDGYNPRDLIDELKKKPRPLTDVENAILLKQQIDSETELRNVNEAINNARDRGDESALSENQVRKSRLQDELQDIYDVGRSSGTENARGLATRKMLATDDYSLAAMVSKKRAANGGEKLTNAQMKEIEKQHSEIQDKLSAYEKKIKELEARVKELESRKPVAKKAKEIANSIRGLKINKGNVAQANILAIPAAIWDGAIETIATAIEEGGALADAIQRGIDHLKKDGYLKNDKEEEDFKNHIYIQSKQERPFVNLLDPEVRKLKAEYERAKSRFDADIYKDEQAKETKFSKAADFFVKWERAGKLSWPTTLAKLASAGLTRLVQSPIEDIAGKGIGAVLPKKVTSKAHGETGFNVKAQAKALTSAFTTGIQDAKAVMSKGHLGKSDIDFAFGNRKVSLPPEVAEFFGHLHGAIKAPIKRAIFEKSMEKRIANNIKAGNDVTDPLVQTQIAVSAYKDANRAIFMQDNLLADAYSNLSNYLEKNKQFPTAGKAISSGMKYLLPFVKVPTNIAGETFTLSGGGLVMGGAKLIHTAFTKGLANLSVEEADMISRNLKKGAIGTAALLLGYFNPNSFGGYYQDEDYKHRKPGDLKANQMKLFGVTLPSWLLHAPLFNAMQFGATVRRVKDEFMEKREDAPMWNGVMAGGLGLIKEVPLAEQPMEVAKLFNPKERDYYAGELAKNTVDPGLIQFAAKLERGYNPWTEETSRKASPETIMQHVETGIPGLTENVPEKGKSKKKKYAQY